MELLAISSQDRPRAARGWPRRPYSRGLISWPDVGDDPVLLADAVAGPGAQRLRAGSSAQACCATAGRLAPSRNRHAHAGTTLTRASFSRWRATPIASLRCPSAK
eukprot:2065843-Pyramimonas_sp.AAC.1